MNLGIDHGYYAIKTKNFSFPAGVTAYSHEPYTLQDTLEADGKFFVCGTGRQPILRDKTENDSYCLLTLAAIAKDLKCRGASPECSVTIAAGLLKVQKSTFLYQRGQFVLCTYNFFVRVL